MSSLLNLVLGLRGNAGVQYQELAFVALAGVAFYKQVGRRLYCDELHASDCAAAARLHRGQPRAHTQHGARALPAARHPLPADEPLSRLLRCSVRWRVAA